MKKRISAKLRSARFLFIAIGIIVLIALSGTVNNEVINQEHFIVEIVFLITSIVLYYLFDKAKTVEFDGAFMYVSNKETSEKIPLENVYKIKLTMTKINNRSMWKIGYKNNQNIEKSVRVLPRWIDRSFDDFVNSVRAANKDLSYRSWSHSFDFDQ